MGPNKPSREQAVVSMSKIIFTLIVHYWMVPGTGSRVNLKAYRFLHNQSYITVTCKYTLYSQTIAYITVLKEIASPILICPCFYSFL